MTRPVLRSGSALRQYRFYPEVILEPTLPANTFRVLSPWLELEVEFPPGETPEAGNFSGYPLVHAIPSALPEDGTAAIATKQDCFPPWLFSGDRIPKSDLEPALAESRIQDSPLHDPLSIYTSVRARVLRSENETLSAPLFEALEHLRSHDESEFFCLAESLLQQTYFVTSRCISSLKPALQHEPIREEVTHYIRSEEGHHLLIADSLKHLGSAPDLARALPETRLLMELLENAASSCPLTFSCMIGFFEGSDLDDTDPLAALLDRSSKPRASRGVQKHFEINRDGHHGAIGGALASKLGAASELVALQAHHFAHVAIQLRNQLHSNLLKTLISN